MDAGESGTSRQSGFTSYSRPETFSHYSRDSAEKQSRERPPNMAAVALMSSAPAYHPHHQSYPQSYSQQSPAPMPGILTPAEPPRRVSKDSEPAQRQSLPSISEMFNAKPSGFPPTTPTTAAGPSHLPPPPPPPVFHQNVPPPPAPRPEPSAESRSQPPLFTQRPDNGPPGTAYQYGESREPSRPVDLHRNGSFSGSHAPPVAYPGPSQLPPGQLPLSQAPPPISPRHPMPPQFETQRPPMHSDEEVGAPRRYDSNNLNQQFEVWGYTDCLQRVMWASRTVYNFAEAYANIASEQHGGQPIPQRLPTDKEVSEMLHNTDYLKKTLDSIREVVHHSIASEKERNNGKNRSQFDDDDVSMYGDGMKRQYGLGEVKKRRGRAAPPGRCHSCNRIDTPEWRRGPDGARTLCNACGLHYAKLERRRQMDQRNMRGKAPTE